jgi:hypothetical protein
LGSVGGLAFRVGHGEAPVDAHRANPATPGEELRAALVRLFPAAPGGNGQRDSRRGQRQKSVSDWEGHLPRVGATDIGVFESQGFTLALSSGNNQRSAVNTAFAQALAVSVTANNTVEPVAGGALTFTAPIASGASAVLSGSPATIGADGKASVTATANGTAGAYTVSASATGVASPANFSLTNSAPAALLASSPSPQ